MPKLCTKCQHTKSDMDFSPSAKLCKECMAANQASYHQRQKNGGNAPKHGCPKKPEMPMPVNVIADANPLVAADHAKIESDYDKFSMKVQEILSGIDHN